MAHSKALEDAKLKPAPQKSVGSGTEESGKLASVFPLRRSMPSLSKPDATNIGGRFSSVSLSGSSYGGGYDVSTALGDGQAQSREMS